MAEYIEREALKELVKKHFKFAIDAGMHSLDVVDTACAMTSLIDGVDKADVAEVRHARWVKDKTTKAWICTNCGIGAPWDYTGHKYCHTCGAKMDGGADNEG